MNKYILNQEMREGKKEEKKVKFHEDKCFTHNAKLRACVGRYVFKVKVSKRERNLKKVEIVCGSENFM